MECQSDCASACRNTCTLKSASFTSAPQAYNDPASLDFTSGSPLGKGTLFAAVSQQCRTQQKRTCISAWPLALLELPCRFARRSLS
jgi:hypothetical protein